ncbi:MAG TPA: ABC transporter permease [Thermoanaerobaculales bacterium]|nr:ABC transporter permease [Thermoanaerobaculales bacterium]
MPTNPAGANAPATVVIEPSRALAGLGLAEIWAYRELLYFLVWRDIKVRYKQTVLGAIWAILQPLLTAVVFTLFFGRLAGIPSDGLPYPVFSYAGLLVWTFFAQAVTQAAVSLVSSANLISKVYFPRALVPMASIFGGLVDLAIAFPLLGVFMLAYHVPVAATFGLFPVFLVLAVATALGVGLWLSAITLEYRDVRYVVPFIVQLWLFVSPVIYPSSTVVPRLRALGLPDWLLGLNPMAGVVEGFRWSLLGTPSPPLGVMVGSAVVSVLVLISGALYFHRVERSFADVI